MARGVDVFRLTPSEQLSQNEIDAAMLVHATEFNPQQQPKVVWPASSVVARAYVDQLARSKSIQPEQASAIVGALERVDRLRSGRDNGAAAVLDELDALAGKGSKAMPARRRAATRRGCARSPARSRAGPPLYGNLMMMWRLSQPREAIS